jgi:sucrose-6-phosphate hydrolase SacC (GH32 family)
LSLNNTLAKIDEVSSNSLEVLAELELGSAKSCGLELRRSADGSAGMRIAYDGKSVMVESIGPELLIGPEKRQEWWANKNVIPAEGSSSGKVTLHIFLDRGVLEVFVNDRVTFERSIEHLALENAGVTGLRRDPVEQRPALPGRQRAPGAHDLRWRAGGRRVVDLRHRRTAGQNRANRQDSVL